MPVTESAFRIRRAHWPSDRVPLRFIREQVFVEEQGVPLELERDGRDENAVHLLAEDTQGRPIGTARMLPDGRIGRMAVLAPWRRGGVGAALLQELLGMARAEARPPPFLNAQSSALGFYLRAGFVPVGPEFEEAGIPHRRMHLDTWRAGA